MALERTSKPRRREQREKTKIARRRGESTIFEVPEDHFEAFLEPFCGTRCRPSLAVIPASELTKTHTQFTSMHVGLGRPLEAILGPSWGHPGPSWGHLDAILAPFQGCEWREKRKHAIEREEQTNLAKFARRLGESTIFEVPGGLVEAFWKRFRAILGPLHPQMTPT